MGGWIGALVLRCVGETKEGREIKNRLENSSVNEATDLLDHDPRGA